MGSRTAAPARAGVYDVVAPTCTLRRKHHSAYRLDDAAYTALQMAGQLLVAGRRGAVHTAAASYRAPKAAGEAPHRAHHGFVTVLSAVAHTWRALTRSQPRRGPPCGVSAHLKPGRCRLCGGAWRLDAAAAWPAAPSAGGRRHRHQVRVHCSEPLHAAHAHRLLLACTDQRSLQLAVLRSVLTLDNRGVGKSSCPRPKSAYRTTVMAQDVLALMVGVWQP